VAVVCGAPQIYLSPSFSFHIIHHSPLIIIEELTPSFAV
jgi:hypothetical protein